MTWTSLHTGSRAHAKLALPLCLGHVGHQLMAMVDSAMVGHFDRTALAGFSVANSLLMTITFFGVGILLGLDSLIPQAIGRQRPEEAHVLFHSGKRLALQLGLPLTLLAGLSPLSLPLFGVQDDVAAEATLYLYGRLPSLVFVLMFSVHASFLQATNVTRPIVFAVILGNLVNLISDAVLVFGDDTLDYCGLPRMGIPALGGLGAALSTCLVTLAMTMTLAYAVAKQGISAHKADVRVGAKIRKVGMPIGLQLLAEVGIFAVTGVLAGRLGALPSASHQVALALASLSFSVALGMGAATSVRVGHAVGAGSHAEARQAGLIGVFWAAILMLTAGVFFLLMPRTLAGLFTNDTEVINAVAPLLAIAAVFQLSDGTQTVLNGALRGAGDTKATFVGSALGHYALGIWISVGLGFGLGWGVDGLWWGLSAGLSATAVGLAIRFWWLTSRPIEPR